MSELAVVVERADAPPTLPEGNIITVAGRLVNLGLAVPLKVGDWRKLAAAGVDVVKLSSGTGTTRFGVEEMAVIAQYVVRKADPSFDPSFVDELDMEELGDIVGRCMSANAKAGKVDRPT